MSTAELDSWLVVACCCGVCVLLHSLVGGICVQTRQRIIIFQGDVGHGHWIVMRAPGSWRAQRAKHFKCVHTSTIWQKGSFSKLLLWPAPVL